MEYVQWLSCNLHAAPKQLQSLISEPLCLHPFFYQESTKAAISSLNSIKSVNPYFC